MRILLTLLLLFSLYPARTDAAESTDLAEIYSKRMQLYKNTEAITNIPWYYLAAVDQYERSIRKARRDLPKAEGLTGIYFKPEEWAGLLNPD
ncbi:hypothetical protein B14911_09562, partial [Bacillus sp. NRRL B-14911]